MNLINKYKIRKLFYKNILNISKRNKQNGKIYFPTKPNPELNSYFKKRKLTSFVNEDFEIEGCSFSGDLEKSFKLLWQSQNNPELCRLAKKFVELAESLHRIEKQEEEISPFIYVMF